MEEHHESTDKPELMTSPGRMRRGIVIVAVTLAIGFGIVFTLWDEMFANPPPVTRLQTGEPTPPPPAQAGVTQITMLSGAAVSGAPDYDPDDDATVPLGNKVVWNNADTVPHTATSGSGPEDAESAALFDTGIVNGGEESSETEIPGDVGAVIPYYCIVHPYMTSQLTITEAEEGGAGGGAASGPTINIPSGASVQGSPDYDPDELTVKKGDTVNVVNADSAPHTVTSGTGAEDEASASSFDSGILDGGASGKIETADLDAGDYPYYCIVHPYMKGALVVTE